MDDARLETDEDPIVIGLAGAIGAGKSTVARLLEEHGWVRLDYDELAAAALDRPDVRTRLVDWWGAGNLDGDGRVRRRAVAEIVFEDAAERQRLEALVPPLLPMERDELLAAARRAGAHAVVVDAPLLFEAGLDARCDVILFVDAPEPLRRARVRTSRGWDARELARRDSAQLPASEKRSRADHVILNDGDLDEIRRHVAEVCATMLARG